MQEQFATKKPQNISGTQQENAGTREHPGPEASSPEPERTEAEAASEQQAQPETQDTQPETSREETLHQTPDTGHMSQDPAPASNQEIELEKDVQTLQSPVQEPTVEEPQETASEPVSTAEPETEKEGTEPTLDPAPETSTQPEPEAQPVSQQETETIQDPEPATPEPETSNWKPATQEPEPEAPEPEVQPTPQIQKPETDQHQPEPPKDSGDLSDDEEILKFIEETKQKIFIIGTGGSGSNTLDRLFELGTTGVSLLAMNTDAKHLLKTRANRKIILGKKISKGRGAGSNPAVGEKAAKESEDEIKNAIGDGSLVFITCGLGGGTGTGSAPVIAEAAKNMGALTVAVVTLPFTSEGKIRMDNAIEGMEKLKKYTDTLIVIKNDKLLNLVPDLPLNTAFKVCDEVLAGSVKGIAELVTRSGLVNVDFADLKTILSDAGYAAIGLGEASLDAKQEDRARVAVETALSSPLLDSDISSSTRALINVIGGEDMTLKEAEFIVAETSRRINPNAHIIWGARVEENIKKSSMRVLVVLAGVKFPRYEFQPKDSGVDELDLDLIG